MHTDRLQLNFWPRELGKAWFLKTPEFCTDYFFKCHTARSLTVDNVWNAYDDLCRTLLSLQRNGVCQHIDDYYFRNPAFGDTGCHSFNMCGQQAWFKGCCYLTTSTQWSTRSGAAPTRTPTRTRSKVLSNIKK
jgi:hypothetical protein